VIKVITGTEAAAYGVLLSHPEIICAYPITPQSRIPELLSEFCAQGILKAKFVNAESEMGSIGYVLGASAGGVRVFTATSSQGLAWMHEGLHWAAGARLPIVMVNVNRPFTPPGNITSDQTDSMSQRDTGWMQFYCESNQEVLDTIIEAYKVSELIGLPSMVCLDGIYLSHISESVEIPEQDRVDYYLPPYEPSFSIDWGYKLYYEFPTIRTDSGNPTDGAFFMLSRYELHKAENQCVDAILKANQEFQVLFGRGYPPVEEYKCDDADLVVVTCGSTFGTCRTVIESLRDKGYKVGLVKLKMFRPFPRELIRRVLTGRKKIAVIERDLSPGQCGIIYQEIKWALHTNVPMYGFVSGLGGGDITPELIDKAILFSLREDPPQHEVIWLGLVKKETTDEFDRISIKIS
jgi:pyruvate ferredoxin oxidoreductase alpha subunit